MNTVLRSLPQAPAASHGAIARQSIVDANLRVFAYALLGGRWREDAREANPAFLRHALQVAHDSALAQRRTVFVRCGIDTITDPILDAVDPRHTVLEVALPTAFDTARILPCAAALQVLVQKGFRIAFDHEALAPAWRPWLRHASFIRVDMRMLPRGLLSALVGDTRPHRHLRLIASNVQGHAEHESARGLGITLFQGQWYAQPRPVAQKLLRADHAAALQLLQWLREDRPMEQIEAVLKRDAALSFNLLRFVNSAAVGAGREITSLRTAAMLLGSQKLFRWSTLLLAASRDGAPPALGHTAIARARLMELLAPHAADDAFVVGAFSLLEAITGQPIATVLANLALAPPVRQALLERGGPLAPYLALAQACEAEDPQACEQAAAALGIDTQALDTAHMQALAWAEEFMH